MKRNKALICLIAALSIVSVSAALTACTENNQTPPAHEIHVFDGWSLTSTPTATTTGTASRTCTSGDGYVETKTLPVLTDSRYSITENTATATKGGVGKYTITLDGEVFVFYAETPALGEPEQPKTEYTVHFNLNGHGVAIADAQTVDGKVSKPTDPTDENYDFGGWYTDAVCTTVFDFNTALTAETILYAKWTAKPVEPEPATEYTVHFNLNGHGTAIADAQTVDGK
ncbi:MAG: InlB B-repeat-containing protein, partial [Candidatus Coproplasma sp.]